MITDGIPHYAKVAWELDALSRQDTDKLNAYKIADAAVKIADQDGLANTTIRAIAKETGFTTMAVYRHIESRDELVVIMTEVAMGPAKAYGQPEWQDNLRCWSDDLLQRYVAHPWVLDVQIAGMPTTPNHISWLEQFLRLLDSTTLTVREKLDVSLLVDSYVRQFARMQNSHAPTKLLSSSVPPDWLMDHMAQAAPYFSEVLRQGFLQSENGPSVTAGMDVIIDGIERLQTRRG